MIMTLVTITHHHLPAAAGRPQVGASAAAAAGACRPAEAAAAAMLRLNIAASCSSADQLASLSLSAHSPHSSLTSPVSTTTTDYNGSQTSVRCSPSSPSSPTGSSCSDQCRLAAGGQCHPLAGHQLRADNPALLQVAGCHQKARSLSQSASVASEPATPARRLSRIEHRQSLSDLGYGKIESYFKLQRLGKGTYATVYMGRSRLSNDLVALKEILKEHDEGAPCTAIREVSLLRLLRHNNIVTLHDICHTPKKLTLVFEYVGPDLYAYMKENNHLLSIHNVRVSIYRRPIALADHASRLDRLNGTRMAQIFFPTQQQFNQIHYRQAQTVKMSASFR